MASFATGPSTVEGGTSSWAESCVNCRTSEIVIGQETKKPASESKSSTCHFESANARIQRKSMPPEKPTHNAAMALNKATHHPLGSSRFGLLYVIYRWVVALTTNRSGLRPRPGVFVLPRLMDNKDRY